MVNEPQFGYSAGMGLFFIQPPMANWLKSSQGLQERSRLASLNPQPAGAWPLAPFARKAPRLPTTRMTTAKIRRTAIEDAMSLPRRLEKIGYENAFQFNNKDAAGRAWRL